MNNKGAKDLRIQLVAGLEQSCFGTAEAISKGVLEVYLSLVNSWSGMDDASMIM